MNDGADPLDQYRHFITDLPDIARARRQRREVRSVADPHQQQVAVLHLDHRLHDVPAVEQLRGTGYDVRKYQVDLQRKVAFPFVTLIHSGHSIVRRERSKAQIDPGPSRRTSSNP